MFKGFKYLDNLSSLNFSQVAYKLPLKALLYRGVNYVRDNSSPYKKGKNTESLTVSALSVLRDFYTASYKLLTRCLQNRTDKTPVHINVPGLFFILN